MPCPVGRSGSWSPRTGAPRGVRGPVRPGKSLAEEVAGRWCAVTGRLAAGRAAARRWEAIVLEDMTASALGRGRRCGRQELGQFGLLALAGARQPASGSGPRGSGGGHPGCFMNGSLPSLAQRDTVLGETWQDVGHLAGQQVAGCPLPLRCAATASFPHPTRPARPGPGTGSAASSARTCGGDRCLDHPVGAGEPRSDYRDQPRAATIASLDGFQPICYLVPAATTAGSRLRQERLPCPGMLVTGCAAARPTRLLGSRSAATSDRVSTGGAAAWRGCRWRPSPGCRSRPARRPAASRSPGW